MTGNRFKPFKRQRSTGWGHPVGIKAAALWSNCPPLALPAGVKEITCDGSTCMQVCEDGKASVGKRRTKCRWKRNVGFFWKRVSSMFFECAWVKLRK